MTPRNLSPLAGRVGNGALLPDAQNRAPSRLPTLASRSYRPSFPRRPMPNAHGSDLRCLPTRCQITIVTTAA
jgi:hypothetical protein